jgi:aspartate kinase
MILFKNTDVPGVMSSDPRRIPDARVIPRLSYAEAMELALLGAKKMHPKTFEPLVGSSTRVRITMPGAQEATIVDREGGPPPLKAVVVSEGLSVVTVVGGGLVGRIGVASRVAGIAARLRVNLLSIMQPITETRISLVVRKSDASKLAAALAEELENVVSTVERVDVAAVSIVGDGLRDSRTSGEIVEKAAKIGGVRSILWAPGSPILVVYVEPPEAWDIARTIHEEVVSRWPTVYR